MTKLDEYYTTAGEFRDSHEDCTANLTDHEGNDLDDGTEITVSADGQQYCIGRYDGNQTWIDLY